ncbi:25S rRNA (uracil2634-N3)-methyltransferase [Sarracenia purpurea var. burkii]
MGVEEGEEDEEEYKSLSSEEDEEEYKSMSSEKDEEEADEEEGEEEEEEDEDDFIYGSGNRERWIEHYASSHRILLVGEGDFSFSLCLGKAFASARNMVATCLDTQQDLANKYRFAMGNVGRLEEMGCLVLYGVDATKMREHYFLRTQRFDRIVYNFPHVGFIFPEGTGCQIKLNKQLVKEFMMNAKVLLRREEGEIHVTHKDGDPYKKWDLVKKAEKIGLVLHESVIFCKDKYPGYDNKRAHGSHSDAPFRLGDCTTFKFRLAHSCYLANNGK